MRKCGAYGGPLPGGLDLQCGRIYKDAEIRTVVDLPSGAFSGTFNVAASIKMRKSPLSGREHLPCRFPLQCGRIYKDAEIRCSNPCYRPRDSPLQCGRIYKDAEMDGSGRCSGSSFRSFNVAASIKMRKSHWGDRRLKKNLKTFNVAASIKMRKYIGDIFGDGDFHTPSMWPHL